MCPDFDNILYYYIVRNIGGNLKNWQLGPKLPLQIYYIGGFKFGGTARDHHKYTSILADFKFGGCKGRPPNHQI